MDDENKVNKEPEQLSDGMRPRITISTMLPKSMSHATKAENSPASEDKNPVHLRCYAAIWISMGERIDN